MAPDAYTGEERRQSIESRVATHDAQIASLSNDIKALSSDLRDLGGRVESQIQSLLVAVEKASAPRRTDWGTLIAAVGLIIAIGGAALGPAFWRLGRLEDSEVRIGERIQEHGQLDLHPVGKARIDALDKDLDRRLTELDIKLQRESQLLTEAIRVQVQTLRDDLSTVRAEGSPITRERLAVLEARLDFICDKKSEAKPQQP